jgi:hypothetical protein
MDQFSKSVCLLNSKGVRCYLEKQQGHERGVAAKRHAIFQ